MNKNQLDMRGKIKQHYKTEFSSSNNGALTITETEIDFIIKHDCECSICGESIFELYDFPELLIDDDELLCELCYDSEYTQFCPICEETYNIYDGESDYSVVVENDNDHGEQMPGIYYNNNLITPIRMNDYKKIECGDRCEDVYSDKICIECAMKYTKKNRFLLIGNTPSLLIKKQEGEFFKDWTLEKIKRHRKGLIHKRITCRGLIEKEIGRASCRERV